MLKNNLLHVPESLTPDGPEFFETILAGAGAPTGSDSPEGLLVERIISHGHATPEGEWYDQERDEWVMVLQGEARLAYADGTETHLAKGGHVFLPKHLKHRVVFSSSPCIWLAVHGKGLCPGPALDR